MSPSLPETCLQPSAVKTDNGETLSYKRRHTPAADSLSFQLTLAKEEYRRATVCRACFSSSVLAQPPRWTAKKTEKKQRKRRKNSTKRRRKSHESFSDFLKHGQVSAVQRSRMRLRVTPCHHALCSDFSFYLLSIDSQWQRWDILTIVRRIIDQWSGMRSSCGENWEFGHLSWRKGFFSFSLNDVSQLDYLVPDNQSICL